MDNFICKKDKIDVVTVDSKNDTYPCKKYKCKFFHKSEDPLIDAIFYLQILRVQEILNTMTHDEVIEYKITIGVSLHYDILNYILSEFAYMGNGYNPSLSWVSWYSLRLFNNHDDYKINNNLACNLVEYICSTYPELITEELILQTNNFACEKITDTLMYYYKDKPNTNQCFVCFSCIQNQLILCTCVCNTYIHLNCLIKLVKLYGDICSSCKTSLNSFVDSRRRIHFPHNDIYVKPLFSSYVFANKNSLHYACAYLCVKRVKEILDKMSWNEFKYYMKSADYYGLHIITNNKLKLIDNPYTNLSRNNHKLSFNSIENMLEKKCNILENCTELTDILTLHEISHIKKYYGLVDKTNKKMSSLDIIKNYDNDEICKKYEHLKQYILYLDNEYEQYILKLNLQLNDNSYSEKLFNFINNGIIIYS